MYIFNDGGRSAAGYKCSSRDCGVRAVAIAIGLEYKTAQKLLKEYSAKGMLGSKAISKGIFKEDLDAALESLGWVWVEAPKFEGRKAKYSDIPGTAILRMAKHFVAVVDGVLYDTWDSREKMVYGYWKKREV